MQPTDWRTNLRLNNRRTRFVILLFVSLYLSLGLLVDLLMIMGKFTTQYGQTVNITQALGLILSLTVFPYATITAGIAASIGLFITYIFHDRLMLLGTKYHRVSNESSDLAEKQLYHIIEELKIAAGLSYMPKIFIIEAGYMNAFASGYSEKSAMIAITHRLMEQLSRSELQAVMAHELSHIRHQDIKLTLTASVLSNLILLVLDLVFYKFLFTGGRRSQQQQILFMIIIILRYVMPLITILLMMYLSRTREFMADAGCVELTRDNEPLANALIKIHKDHNEHSAQARAAYANSAHEEIRRAAYLYDPKYARINAGASLNNLFSTHPPLRDRLAALGIQLNNES